MQHLADAQDIEITVDSAGTQAYHVGEAPDARSVRTAAQHGVAMQHLRARQVTTQDFYDFDVILAMDEGHLRALNGMKPVDATAQVDLFLHYALGQKQEVKDPYYGGQRGFDEVFSQCFEACEAILEKYIKNH